MVKPVSWVSTALTMTLHILIMKGEPVEYGLVQVSLVGYIQK